MISETTKKILRGGLLLLLLLIAVVRVISADRTVAQGFDEPCHLAAGIKWLDQHDYTLDAVHPPLARYAIALPLYLGGQRTPRVQTQEGSLQGYCTEIGNAILADGAHYTRNILLARIGILPFLCLGAILVFCWADLEFGYVGAYVALFLFLTLPSVLAFSGLAYTDLPTMCTQFACIFSFSTWLKKMSTSSTVLLGLSIGVALSSKFTSFLYLPLACGAMLLFRLVCSRKNQKEGPGEEFGIRQAAQLLVAAGIGLTLLWGSYAFSVGHLRRALGTSPTATSLVRPPTAGTGIFEKIVQADPVIPAPDLVRGIELARLKNKHEPDSYLLGEAKSGGWWYFFPLAVFLKTPIPFSVLAILGLGSALWQARRGQWSKFMPAVAVIAIFVATSFVTLRVGTRHVLAVWPLLAVLSGGGAVQLWGLSGEKSIWGKLALCALLTCQGVTSIRAQGDLLAYFNALAPSNASEALVKGCDLDCGQDVVRLSQALRDRGIKRVSIGVCTSADMSLLNLPTLDILPPRKPVTGWVAVSLRALKTGSFRIYQGASSYPNEDYPHDALSWLEKYEPVARIGKTILLYQIPEKASESAKQTTSLPKPPEWVTRGLDGINRNH